MEQKQQQQYDYITRKRKLNIYHNNNDSVKKQKNKTTIEASNKWSETQEKSYQRYKTRKLAKGNNFIWLMANNHGVHRMIKNHLFCLIKLGTLYNLCIAIYRDPFEPDDDEKLLFTDMELKKDRFIQILHDSFITKKGELKLPFFDLLNAYIPVYIKNPAHTWNYLNKSVNEVKRMLYLGKTFKIIVFTSITKKCLCERCKDVLSRYCTYDNIQVCDK